MTSKNPRARHRRFLAAGFFPPELPPCFYSEHLGKFRNAILNKFNAIPPTKTGKPDFHVYVSNHTSFNFPRFRSSDRRHAFINPVSYFYLSKVLSDHYVELRKVAKKSKLTLSPSIFDWSGERALKKPIFDSRDEFLGQLNARFEYILNTDIRAFYHSLYTHAIPWAVHTKPFAKKNRSSNHVGNLIDLLCRNAQDGQTIGLPVGPDTSRMIAELVGSSIDRAIQKHLSADDGNAMRFVDDFCFGCNDRRTAEKASAIVRRAANEFELDLNNEKTTIDTSSSAHPGGWKSYIRSLLPKSPYEHQEVARFIYQVDRLAHEDAAVNIQKFSIQNARRVFVESKEWQRVEQYLIATYRSNATILENLVELFLLRNAKLGDVSVASVRDLVQSRMPTLYEQRRNGEAVWLLFLANSLSVEIRAKCLEGFFDEDDPMVAVLISDANKRGLIKGKVNFSHWNKSLTSDGLDGSMWLYAYETTLKGTNTSSKTSHVSGHRYFSHLYDRKIEFYRSTVSYEMSSLLKKKKKENFDIAKLLSEFDHNFDLDEIDSSDEFDDNDVY